MSFHIKAGVTALALILTPIAVAAHHKSGHDGGNGRGHSAQEDRGNRNHDHADRDEAVESEEAVEDEGEVEEEVQEEVAGGRPCAWGLANRETPCVPPGQAKKDVTTDDWIGAPGTVVDETADLPEELTFLGNTDRLPELGENQSYALVGDAVVVVQKVETAGAEGEEPLTSYEYVSTYGRAAFPGQ